MVEMQTQEDKEFNKIKTSWKTGLKGTLLKIWIAVTIFIFISGSGQVINSSTNLQNYLTHILIGAAFLSIPILPIILIYKKFITPKLFHIDFIKRRHEQSNIMSQLKNFKPKKTKPTEKEEKTFNEKMKKLGLKK